MKDHHINLTLETLREEVLAANKPANIYGQLAQHFCSTDTRLATWNVNCDESWLINAYDPTNISSVAILSYTIDALDKREWTEKLVEGFKRASSRDISFSNAFSPIHDPSVIVGLVLGAKYLSDIDHNYLGWIAKIVSKLKSEKLILSKDSSFLYSLYLLDDFGKNLYINDDSSLSELAFFHWVYKRDKRYTVNIAFDELKKRILEIALSEKRDGIRAYNAALMWLSIKYSISDFATLSISDSSGVVYVLKQFKSALKRWRYDIGNVNNPIKWEITAEREVQDILWLILRSYWSDVKDEEALPKFGHSTYDADFAIPSLKLLIEVKYARKSTDFKQIEKDILEDLIPYLSSSYDKIIVFIYDASSSVQHHDETRQALCSVEGIYDVVIVSKPSQLP